MVGVEPLRPYLLRIDSGPWGRKSHTVEGLRLEVFYIDIENLLGGRIKTVRKSLLFSIVRRSQCERMPCKFGRLEQDHEARGI
jgi:hypothetical protein